MLLRGPLTREQTLHESCKLRRRIEANLLRKRHKLCSRDVESGRRIAHTPPAKRAQAGPDRDVVGAAREHVVTAELERNTAKRVHVDVRHQVVASAGVELSTSTKRQV